MGSKLQSLLKTLLFLSFGLIILYLLYHKLNDSYLEECASKGISTADCSLIDKIINDIKSAKLIWLIIIVVCFFISNVARSLRWQQLLTSMGYNTRWGNTFHTTMLGYFANLGVPRLGEFVRAGSLARYEGIAFEKVMGTIVVDRAVDFLCFGLVFLLALVLQYDQLWSYVQANANVDLTSILSHPIFLVITTLALLSVAGTIIFWRSLSKWGPFAKLLSMVNGFLQGLGSLKNVRNKWKFVGFTVVIWSMYYLMTYLCFDAFEPTAHLGPLAGLLIFVFGSLGIIIPTPGGMGSYHALVVAGLVLYGVAQSDAFSFAMIIFFTINIFGNVLFGIIALLLLPGYNQNYMPERA